MNTGRKLILGFALLFLINQGFTQGLKHEKGINKVMYQNPIIHADYSDPDVIAVGNDFYMIASSFNAVPGLPILHSNDLVHWYLISHALPQLVPADSFNTPQHGKGVWAPSIRFHNNEFYIFVLILILGSI